MLIKRLLLGATPALGFGVLLTFGSSFGQTFFISLFAGEIRSELNLSHGMFGMFYSAATLMSAIAFLWLGKFTDQFDLTLLGSITLIALGGFAMLMASANILVILFLSLFGLRLFGQGLLGHVAITAMARWFSKDRGQALSIASLGHSIGEALLPILVAFFLTLLTWREVWIGVSLCMVLIFLPVLYWLNKCLKSRRLDRSQNNLTDKKNISRISWNRAQVLRDIRFYQLMPGILASPFIITGVLFHQVHLVETKSWSLAMFASCYPLYALSATGVTLLAGWIVDRLSAVYLLRFYLLPLGLGLVLIAITDKTYAAPAFMILMGASAGAATITMSALWVELYGTDYIGSIRSMCFAMLVVSTSIAPWLMGLLIDIGITLETQFAIFAIYILVCSIIFTIITPNLLIVRSLP
jgi:sugar phosphate permease